METGIIRTAALPASHNDGVNVGIIFKTNRSQNYVLNYLNMLNTLSLFPVSATTSPLDGA